MKKLFVLLFLTMLAFPLFAQNFIKEIDGVTYAFQIVGNSQLAIVADKKVKNKGVSEYKLPSYVKLDGVEYAVTEIGAEAFKKTKDMMSLVLPSTIKVIRSEAFMGCKNIHELDFPDGLEIIEEKAFFMDPLSSVILPKSMKKIGEQAFFSGNMTINKPTQIQQVYVPKSVKEIGDHAFCRFRNGYGIWYTSKSEILCLPDWVTKDVCKKIGLHEDSFNMYLITKGKEAEVIETPSVDKKDVF